MNMTDAGMTVVAELRRLKTLHLFESKVTAKGLAHLPGDSAIEVLSISAGRARDDALAHVVRLGRLRSLTLSGNFTDRGLAHLVGSTSLREVTLHMDQFSDEGLRISGQ